MHCMYFSFTRSVRFVYFVFINLFTRLLPKVLITGVSGSLTSSLIYSDNLASAVRNVSNANVLHKIEVLPTVLNVFGVNKTMETNLRQQK